MKQMRINGLVFNYNKERDLFNALLKINGVSKKKFCEKFGYSYSYVNAWGSTTSEKYIKFPAWVFHYLKDVMYYKIDAIKVKMPIDKIYERLQNGETLTQIYKELFSTSKGYVSETDPNIFIPEALVGREREFVFEV